MEPQQAPHLVLRLHELLLDKDFEASELFSGIAAFGWGALVAWPYVDTFSTTPTFNAMAELAPEWAWGCGGLLVGILQLWALFYRGHQARYLMAWLALLGWLFMASTFFRANPWSTAVIVYPTLALADAWAVWRLSTLWRAA